MHNPTMTQHARLAVMFMTGEQDEINKVVARLNKAPVLISLVRAEMEKRGASSSLSEFDNLFPEEL